MFKLKDYFKLSINGGVLISNVYKPYINYDWSNTFQVANKMYSKNIGNSGQDLQLFSGNPLDFQGSQYVLVPNSRNPTQKISVVYTLRLDNYGAYYHMDTSTFVSWNLGSRHRVYVNGVNYDCKSLVIGTTYNIAITLDNGALKIYYDGIKEYEFTVGVISNTSHTMSIFGATNGTSLLDGQSDMFIKYHGILTQTQIQQSVEQPNQFFKDMSTNANTLFCTDFRGNARYIADSKNYSNLDISDSLLFVYIGNWEKVDDTYVGTDVTKWSELCRSYTLDNGLYFVSYEIISISGRVQFDNTVNENMYTTSVGVASGFINVVANKLKFVSAEDGTYVVVKNLSIKKLTGVYPITNYSATQRTNFAQVNKGLQELMIERDSLGFFLGLREFPKGNGVGYGDGQNITLDGYFGIEIVFKHNYTATSEWDWLAYVGDDMANYPLVIATQANKVRCSLGSWFTDMVTPTKRVLNVGYNHIYIERDENGDCHFVVNGVYETTTTNNTTVVSNKKLWLFKKGKDYFSDEIKVFKIHKTSQDPIELYNNAQGLLT